MRVKFQADADLNIVILLATVRREPAIDFMPAFEAGLAGRKDPQVLAVAASDGRILVTHDHKTMPGLFGEFIAENISPGLLVIPQHVNPNEAVEDLLMIWAASEAEEWIGRICYLPL